ncbi:MAG: ABC transporter permease [Aeromicrobium sp.]
MNSSASVAEAPTAPALLPAGSRRARLAARALQLGLLPVLLAIAVIVFASLEPRFLTTLNATNVARQLSFLAIVTLAQMAVLLTAEIDMSVASNIALTSVVSSWVMVEVGGEGLAPIVAGVVAGLCVGLVMGLVNGFVVALFGVPSFIVTIGTGAIAFGLGLTISSGSPITGLPSDFTRELGSTDFGMFPLSFLFAAVALIGMYVLLNWTTLGHYLYAVGGGESAARLLGVPVLRSKVLAFVISGVLTSVAAVLLTARVASGEPNLGTEFLVLSIAAAVLGGTSFFGGEGKVGMVAVGALFLVVLSNGMNLIRIASYTQEIIIGALLVLAVIVDRVRARV